MNARKFYRKLSKIILADADKSALLGVVGQSLPSKKVVLSRLDYVMASYIERRRAKTKNTESVKQGLSKPDNTFKSSDFVLPVGYKMCSSGELSSVYEDGDGGSKQEKTTFMLTRRGHRVGEVVLLVSTYINGASHGDEVEEIVSYLHYASDLGGDGVTSMQHACDILIQTHQEYIDNKARG